MQKKQQKKVVGILAVLLAIIILFYFVSVTNFLSIAVLSISDVQVENDGAKILVYARQGGGQELRIDFTPNVLNQYLENKGFRATESSTLTARYEGGQVNIPFSTSENEYNTIKLLKTPVNLGTTLTSCDINKCKNKGYINTISAYSTGDFADFDCYCVEEYNNGYILPFNSGFSSRVFEIEWDLDGSKKVMTSDVNSINFGNKAEIRWNGNLLSNNQISVPNYDVFHVGSSWYLVDKNADSRVSSAYTDFKRKVSESQLTKSEYDSAKSEYYSVVNSFITSNNNDYLKNVPNVKSISFSEGLMIVNFDQPTFLPTYTIELSAEKVGIVKLRGDPKIIQCVSDQKFNQAGSKTVSLLIENKGDTDASFRIYTECNNNEIFTNSQELDFNSDEIKEVRLLLSGGNTGTDTNSGNCRVYVKDANSNNQDTCSFDVDVEYESGISECVGDESACSPDGRNFYICEDGIFVQKDCPIGYECEESFGEARCVEDNSVPPIDIGDGCYWYDIPCKIKKLFGTLNTLFDIIRWIALSIASLMGLIISRSKLSEILKKKDKTTKVSIWIISLLVAGLIAFILYTVLFTWIFWALMIGFILFSIVLKFIPFRF